MSADRMMLIIIYLAVNFLVTFASKENCTVPEILNGYVHEVTEYSEYILLEPGTDLPHSAEILVTCEEDFDITANRLVDENFALKCDNGSFEFMPYCVAKPNYEMKPGRGRFLGARGRDRFQKILNKLSCNYELRADSNIMANHNGSLVPKNATFPDGTTLVFRCTDISIFSLLGNGTRICGDGKWSGKTPHCIRLYSHSFYSPPVISYDVTASDFVVLENGSLSVPQHANLTLHCLWLKDNGDPHWRRNGKYIDKEEIPSMIVWNENEESLDLFIPRIQLNAAGSYVCQPPNRKRHGIDIVVEPRFVYDYPGYGVDSTCLFEPRPMSNTLVFLNGKEISKAKDEFINGTILENICENVLQYKMEGNKTMECQNGQWIGQWPNCLQLNDSAESPPPLDIQITGADKSYFVDDKGVVIVPKDTTVSFVCKYSGGKPVMSLNGARLRQTMGQHRSGASTNWYLRADIPNNSINFTFSCKIPRKDANLFHSVEVIAKGSCKMDARKMQYRWRGSRIMASPERQMYVEDELVNVKCDNSTTSVVPTYFRCGDKGNWISGPNQRCRTIRER